MVDAWLAVLVIALIADWWFGEPAAIWSRFPHPVVLFGRAIDEADRRFNRTQDDALTRGRRGATAIALLVVLAVSAGLAAQWVFGLFGFLWWVGEAFIVFVLVAQRSLIDHVRAVSYGLGRHGLDGGREAVAQIVGRDPQSLDKAGVARAAIESLAENFADGVVAPAFWYALAGLPGLAAYKMINTADSMIGHLNERYADFGRTAAWLDDVANWLPARLSALLIATGAGVLHGTAAGWRAINAALRDAALHRSPNAGWPEAAMAGGCDLALGGPRSYGGATVPQGFIHAAGKRDLDAGDIDRALRVFTVACYGLWALVALLWLL